MTGASCPDFTTAIPYWQAIHRVVKPLQEVQNSAAKLILKSCREKHGKPLLEQLHWLPIEQRIKYKIAHLCYQIITGTDPQYLAELLQSYVPSRSLRSSLVDRTFHIPGFSAAQIWSFLPFALRHSPSLPAFKSNLKTSLQTVFWPITAFLLPKSWTLSFALSQLSHNRWFTQVIQILVRDFFHISCLHYMYDVSHVCSLKRTRELNEWMKKIIWCIKTSTLNFAC